jgi:hypothetical protein
MYRNGKYRNMETFFDLQIAYRHYELLWQLDGSCCGRRESGVDFDGWPYTRHGFDDTNPPHPWLRCMNYFTSSVPAGSRGSNPFTLYRGLLVLMVTFLIES